MHGSDIRNDREILPDVYGRPVQQLTKERVAHYAQVSDSRVRHYQWIRVRDWGNDLVVSYYLRCALRGHSLFVEIKRFLLTPLMDRYRVVDSLATPDWRNVLETIVLSIFVGPLYVAYSTLVLVGKVGEALNNIFDSGGRGRRRLIRKSPLFNYGVERSLRELLSSDRFVHYFQKLDGDFYSKVLEREVLDEIWSGPQF